MYLFSTTKQTIMKKWRYQQDRKDGVINDIEVNKQKHIMEGIYKI
jgi:hypothetical protein